MKLITALSLVVATCCLMILLCSVSISFSEDGNKTRIPSKQIKEYVSPDRTLKALVIPTSEKNNESIIEIRKFTGELLLKKSYGSEDGEHGCTVAQAKWTPDSNFFVYSMYSSGGHQPWHSPIDFYYKNGAIFSLEDFLSDPIAEPEFQVKAPDIIEVNVTGVGERFEHFVQKKIKLSELVARCDYSDKDAFTVHGRLNYWNGNPSRRIWIIGTKRVLGIREECPIPDYLQNKLSFDVDIYGDFLVCPLTKYEPGVMQIVRIKSASHVVIRKRIATRRIPPR